VFSPLYHFSAIAGMLKTSGTVFAYHYEELHCYEYHHYPWGAALKWR
jgi:hypothetical protein